MLMKIKKSKKFRAQFPEL